MTGTIQIHRELFVYFQPEMLFFIQFCVFSSLQVLPVANNGDTVSAKELENHPPDDSSGKKNNKGGGPGKVNKSLSSNQLGGQKPPRRPASSRSARALNTLGDADTDSEEDEESSPVVEEAASTEDTKISNVPTAPLLTPANNQGRNSIHNVRVIP